MNELQYINFNLKIYVTSYNLSVIGALIYFSENRNAWTLFV